jgi:hypothetical protein
MLLATLAVDAAWLWGLPFDHAPTHWQQFMVGGGWAQWSAVILAAVLANGSPLGRAAAATLCGAVLAYGAHAWAPDAAPAYVRLGVVHGAGLAALAVGCRMAQPWLRRRKSRADSEMAPPLVRLVGVPSAGRLAQDAASDGAVAPSACDHDARWRYSLRDWFGWTTLLAVWCAVASQSGLDEFGGSPLLGLANLWGAPLVAWFVASRGQGPLRQAFGVLVAVAGTTALAYVSTRWLYDGPWPSLVASRLMAVNAVHVGYLVAWSAVLQLAARPDPVSLRRMPA